MHESTNSRWIYRNESVAYLSRLIWLYIACKAGDGKPDKKNKGKEKTKKRKKTKVKLCKHGAYGCTICDAEKKKDHLTKVSKYCKFHGKSKVFIALVRGNT